MCSSYFLNNGFCCSVMHVDSKHAVVTLISLQQILILVEAGRPVVLCAADCFPLLSCCPYGNYSARFKYSGMGYGAKKLPIWQKFIFLLYSFVPKSYRRYVSSLFFLCMYLHQFKIQNILQERSPFCICFYFVSVRKRDSPFC